ncbi:unnamed protein product [Mytilus coruscus]|uniref:MAM domain-containing protein n=1 Tax=Mytilus coruscus TaxID=42192 RepID=A0A6J8D2V2_MYTCO|nr:unnamed protein product [Mytilus coruscus]
MGNRNIKSLESYVDGPSDAHRRAPSSTLQGVVTASNANCNESVSKGTSCQVANGSITLSRYPLSDMNIFTNASISGVKIVVLAYFLMCDFETNTCGWNDDDANKYIWKKQNGEAQHAQYPNTGPSTDHSTASGSGYYVSLNSRTSVETTAYFIFHNLEIRLSGISCLTFWYHMYIYNANRKEGINVTIGDKLVWTKFGNQGNKWIKAAINLDIRNISNIKFIGFLGRYWGKRMAIDDISLTGGTCEGLINHEEICVDLDDDMSNEIYCPKGYIDLTNYRLSFDPEKNGCSDQYEKTRMRLFQEWKDGVDSQRFIFDLSTDISSKPECFQLREFRIRHTCEVSAKSVSVPAVMNDSSDSETGLVVGLVVAGLLLICVVILIVVLTYKWEWTKRKSKKRSSEEMTILGCQDIALPQTADRSSHMQSVGMYGQSSSSNTNTNKEVQSPAYAVSRDETFADNQTSNGDEYAMVDHIAETSFNETIDSRTGTASTGYESGKPVKDTWNKIDDEDQYALSEEGVYDRSGSNRHKELEDNIYNHAVDTIYDSGSHKRKNEGMEDTYDHFFGHKTENHYDISSTTSTNA